MTVPDAVFVGVSAGGMAALSVFVPGLPADLRVPVVVVQHVKADSDNYLVHHLSVRSEIAVKEAADKEVLAGGTVYIAPPNYHLLVEDDRSLSLSVDARVQYSRPSVDVLFESAAHVYGPRALGVVLTGANSDGAAGLAAIAKAGGRGIVQTPSQAESQEMPRAAHEAVPGAEVLDLEQIAKRIIDLAGVGQPPPVAKRA